jgi:hypothetical protein
MLTVFGARAVAFMMVMYALERRGRRFILGFACGCALSSIYGFLAGTWPFGAVEVVWAGVALRRYLQTSHDLPPRRSAIPGEVVASARLDRERSVKR